MMLAFRTALIGVVLELGGCGEILGPTEEPDAAVADAAAPDARDAAQPFDAPRDTSLPPRRDAGPGGADARPPAGMDAGPPCMPTHTDCRGELECGMVPNGCPGGAIDCGLCGGGELWCAVLESPRWRDRVWPCVQSVQDANPAWFDPPMACAPANLFVLAASAEDYVRAVATCVNGRGAIALPDANAPGNEIRARGEDDNVADNYIVRTYGTGCTAGRYTSSCTPAMF